MRSNELEKLKNQLSSLLVLLRPYINDDFKYKAINTLIDYQDDLFFDETLETLVFLNENLLEHYFERYAIAAMMTDLPATEWKKLKEFIVTQNTETAKLKHEEEERHARQIEQIINTTSLMLSMLDKILTEDERYHFTSSLDAGEWALPYEDMIFLIKNENIRITPADYEQIKVTGELLSFAPSTWEKLKILTLQEMHYERGRERGRACIVHNFA